MLHLLLLLLLLLLIFCFGCTHCLIISAAPDSRNPTIFLARSAELHGSIREHFNGESVHQLWVECWNSEEEDWIVWKNVRVETDGHYAISVVAASNFVLANCFTGSSSGATIRIVASCQDDTPQYDTIASAVECVLPFYDTLPAIQQMQRIRCQPLLNLGACTNMWIKMTAFGMEESLNVAVHAMEILEESLEPKIAQLAEQRKSNETWLRYAPLGLFLHWNADSIPVTRTENFGFLRAVQDFDVVGFVGMVKTTGATFIVMTLTWGQIYVAAPLMSIEKVIPGRTAARDLIGEIASELEKEGIRLVLYYHYGKEDKEWWVKQNWGSASFWNQWCDIISEVGDRYNTLLSGWWIDDGGLSYYGMNPPWDVLHDCARRGNPQRLIGYNSWALPSATQYQDFYTGEVGYDPLSALKFCCFDPTNRSVGVFTSGPHRGLQPTFAFLFDSSDWTFRSSSSSPSRRMVNVPIMSLDEAMLVLESAVKLHITPIANLAISQEGLVSSESVNLLAKVSERMQAGPTVHQSMPDAPFILTAGTSLKPVHFSYWKEKQCMCSWDNSVHTNATWEISVSQPGLYQVTTEWIADSVDVMPMMMIIHATTTPPQQVRISLTPLTNPHHQESFVTTDGVLLLNTAGRIAVTLKNADSNADQDPCIRSLKLSPPTYKIDKEL